MHTIGMTMKPLHVNMKFVNHLQPKWSKFVTDVKLARDMHSTNFDHLYAYLRQHEAHAYECTKPKRPKKSTWFKEKMLLTDALESGATLDAEQLAFLENNGDTFTPVQASQEIPSPTAFQTDDLDAFDSNCDDAPSAKVILMANLSSYDSDVLSEVTTHDTNLVNDMSYQSMQETPCFEQPSFDNETDFDITSDSNIISYEQYLQEIETAVVQNTNSFAQQDELLMFVIKEMSSQVAKSQRKVPALYDGHTIVKQHDPLFVPDIEETLELDEESRLKMLAKQNDPSLKDKKVNIAPIDYVVLNKLSEHFLSIFLPQRQLCAEQAFWLPILKPVLEIPPVPSNQFLRRKFLVNFPELVWHYWQRPSGKNAASAKRGRPTPGEHREEREPEWWKSQGRLGHLTEMEGFGL
ncbi:hypothetical protein Tco_0787866 [Tanacetum coccineum]